MKLTRRHKMLTMPHAMKRVSTVSPRILSLMLGLGLMHPVAASHIEEWKINIQASVGSTAAQITLGEFAGADDGYDRLYDGPAFTGSSASGASPEVLLYFDHADWEVSDTRFWYDIKAPGPFKQWEFDASSAVTDANLVLTWDLSNLPSDVVLQLTDVATAQSIDMRLQSSYTLPDNALRRFKVVTTPDVDEDGLPDVWENAHFGDLTSASATSDVDVDGLLDTDEYAQRTSPILSDSDDDGLLDGAEKSLGTDPNDSDSDGDGDSDGEEVTYGSSPTSAIDTLNSHRPAQPVIAALSGEITLAGQILDVTGFSDPNEPQGDYLAASEWEISSEASFTTGLKLRKLLAKKDDVTIDATEHRQLVVPDALLAAATDYSIRTRHQDRMGLWSDWSEPLTVSSITTNPDDLDENGINDAYQVTGYTDINGNGTDDGSEGIRAIVDAGMVNQVGLGTDAGTLNSVAAVATSSIPAAHLEAVSMPYGFFSYRIDGLAVDIANPAVAHVTFYFPAPLPANAGWYSYDPSTDIMSDLSANVVMSGNTATLTLVDGGAGDKDGIVNGTIVDPGGPSQPVVVSVAPAPVAGNDSGGGPFGPMTLFAILTMLIMRRRID